MERGLPSSVTVTKGGTRHVAAIGVLLAFVGLWSGHTLEYLRVWGLAGIRAELFGSIHVYMLPLAAVLVGLALIFGLRLRSLWLRLGRRLDEARSDLLGAWRGRRLEPAAMDSKPPSIPARLLALWLPLAALQVSLYLIQENVEAFVAGAPTPGWGAIAGTHWAAPLIQIGVALLLAAALTVTGRLFVRKSALVKRVRALIRALFAHRRRPLAVPRPVQPAVTPPLDALGGHLWRRPPPAFLFG